VRKPLVSRYKRPESVLVVVYNTRGEVLLLRRTQPADFWQSVTGSLRWGESPVQAARRELFEETGIMAGMQLLDLRHTETFPIVAPWRARYAPYARYNREHWFAYAVSGRRLIRMRTAEHREYRWLQAARGLALASSWTNRKAIRRLLLDARP
jgi:dATP pyrophosphohydrolase